MVIWNHGNQYRKSVGLPRKAFHITLTNEDDHGIDTGLMTLDGGPEAVINMFTSLSEDQMDHVMVSKTTLLHRELSKEMVKAFPFSSRSYVRLGDQHINLFPKLAMLAYAQALRLNPGIYDYIRKRLLQMSDMTLWTR